MNQFYKAIGISKQAVHQYEKKQAVFERKVDQLMVEADELRRLLRAHFGAETGAQRFSIAEFRDSFNALFDFFVEHDYRLRSDFVIVGFYLITLYLTLEALGQRHNVRELCLAELDM